MSGNPDGRQLEAVDAPGSRELVLEQLRERIVRFAASRMQKEQAEDMAQETMLVIHQRYPHVTDPAELLPLAFQILRFKMTGQARKTARRGETQSGEREELSVADPMPNPEQAAARAELEARLAVAIPALGERCREIFRLKLLGYGFEEIRRHFQVDSINTVYTWDARCRKSLLERLGGAWEKPR